MPASQTRSVRPTRFSVPAGTTQDIKFCVAVVLAVTVTGVTFVHCHAPVGELVPLLLLFQLGVWVTDSPKSMSTPFTPPNAVRSVRLIPALGVKVEALTTFQEDAPAPNVPPQP